MRVWALAGLLVATSAAATPPGNVSTMTLPAGGGYIQPGNPNRSITAVGRESALVRQREPKRRQVARREAGQHEAAQRAPTRRDSAQSITCTSDGGPRRCPVSNAGVALERRTGNRPCASGRDWRFDARSVTVTNGCRAVFSYRARS